MSVASTSGYRLLSYTSDAASAVAGASTFVGTPDPSAVAGGETFLPTPAYSAVQTAYAAPVTSYRLASWQSNWGSWLSAMNQIMDWASSLVGVPAPQPQPAKPPKSPQPSTPSTPSQPSAGGPTEFRLASFNVLSTNAGKGKKGYALGPERMRNVVQILKDNKIGVAGLQEVDYAQLKAFKQFGGDTFATFAGESGKKNYHDAAIAWRKDQWDLVKGDYLVAPSYEGIKSKVPYVRLRNKQTGQEAIFLDAHNPANTKNYHHQEKYRDAAARMEADLVKRLEAETGLPVFVTGDMNSVSEAKSIFTKEGGLKAANTRNGIDWIFGSKKGVDFSGFTRLDGGIIDKTTDHPVVFSNVKIAKKK